MMRDRIAFCFIELAARLTTCGATYDHLTNARERQHWWLAYLRKGKE